MNADISRDTFDRSKHYRRVLEQQGRVVLDADFNESAAISIATAETTAYDVIGPSGVPETTLAPGYAGGFAIGLNSGGSDLTILRGRMYVDGLLVENDADTTLSSQPFLRWTQPARAAGLYAVYLDAWERLITPIDDPLIVETALGGPDTALRTQVAWQVKLAPIDTATFGDNPSCERIADPWGPALKPGMIVARGGAPASDPGPCVLPPQSGFRSTENQLYRVQIHRGGTYGTATFKWSRENASVEAAITSQLTTGPTFAVQTVGRDASLGFAHGDWVELIDDHSELENGVGQLLQVDRVDAANLTISLQASPSLSVDPRLHPRLRRWDFTVGGTTDGILITNGAPVALENGVEVEFANGTFIAGEYWLIPARTATSEETTGTVEWPIDPSTSDYALLRAHGPKHYRAKLAIVHFNGTTFEPPPGAAAITDCRLFFPPLTKLLCERGPCTLVVQPGANWAVPIAALFNDPNAEIDAEICFPVGHFAASRPVEIATKGNVKVTGAGWGTKLEGIGIESVLRFKNCASAIVSDLAASASRVDAPVDAMTKHINGTLEFEDCGEVRVEGVSLRCGGGPARGAACLTVRSTITQPNASTGAGTVRVLDSSLVVGEMQYGMLLVHQRRAFVERNEIAVEQVVRPPFLVQLQNPQFAAQVEHVLVNSAQIVPQPKPAKPSGVTKPTAPSAALAAAPDARLGAAPVAKPGAVPDAKPGAAPDGTPSSSSASSSSSSSSASSSSAASSSASSLPTAVPERALIRRNAQIESGGHSIVFNTPAQIATTWQTYVNLNAPKAFATSRDLMTFVRASAHTLITDPKARAGFSGFVDIMNFFQRNDVTIAVRGITVGGTGLEELWVRDNTIDGVMQGIVVGLSHRERKPPAQPANVAGAITISGNTVRAAVDAVRGYTHARYGIFCGNAASVQIENNTVSLSAPPGFTIAADGIRVYGYLGRKMIVRHNDVRAFSRGAVVVALKSPGVPLAVNGSGAAAVTPISLQYAQPTQRGNLWLIADNVFENVSTPIATNVCMETGNMNWKSGEVASAP
jgi:hypothetical protein